MSKNITYYPFAFSTLCTSHTFTGEPKLHHLAASISTKLSQELRDMILTYIWEAQAVCTLQLPRHLRSRGDAAGHQIALEAVQWLFENSQDIKLDGLGQLASLFEKDRFDVEMSAKTFKLRKLTLLLDSSYYLPDLKAFDSLIGARLHDEFALDIRMCHDDDKDRGEGMRTVINCTPWLIAAAVILTKHAILFRITYENGRWLTWDLTDLAGKSDGQWVAGLQSRLNQVCILFFAYCRRGW